MAVTPCDFTKQKRNNKNAIKVYKELLIYNKWKKKVSGGLRNFHFVDITLAKAMVYYRNRHFTIKMLYKY